MRTIAAVTVARSDYGILRPVLRALANESGVSLRLVAAGSHYVKTFGSTVRDVRADGFDVSEAVEMSLASDTPVGIATSMGVGVMGFARAYERIAPDLLLLIGDRFEMLAAAVAALPFAMPIAHLHGGELSQGAVDDQIRHAITKMSHLHFVSTEAAARRVMQMGEEAWRVTVSGAPSLDNLRTIALLPPEALSERLGVPVLPAPLLVTFHPETIEYRQTAAQVADLLAALSAVRRPMVITYPNADTANQDVIDALRAFTAGRSDTVLVEHLGTQMYFSLMRCAAAMVGNSSSGIVEAASFALPVVNVGARQAGRDRAANVIDVPIDRQEIAAALDKALAPAFAASLRGMVNPYGDGHAAERIVRVLADRPLDAALRTKRFADLAQPIAGGRVLA